MSYSQTYFVSDGKTFANFQSPKSNFVVRNIQQFFNTICALSLGLVLAKIYKTNFKTKFQHYTKLCVDNLFIKFFKL